MKSIWISRFLFILHLLFLTSCELSSSSSNFHFSGDGSTFLVDSNELPSQWMMENSWEVPLMGGNEWRRTYVTPNLPLERIVSSAAVFDQEEEAIKYWDEIFEWQKGSQDPPCVNSPREYTSNVANQFQVFCVDSDGLVGIFAYEYFILARYGNVVITFGAVAVNEPDMSVAQASEAGVLRWTEMEALLERIDEKFQQAMTMSVQ